MAEPKSDILQGTLDLLALKTLDAMGPLHGYGIAKADRTAQRRCAAGEPGNHLPVPGAITAEEVDYGGMGNVGEQPQRPSSIRFSKAGRKQLRAETENWEIASRE